MSVIKNNVRKIKEEDLRVELPKNERREIKEITKYKIWVYGQPFAGKTHFADTFPNTIILNTDSNVNYVKSPVIQLENYTQLVGAINSLREDKNYETVVIDLIEDIYSLVRKHIFTEHDITHESDKAYGLGWDLVKTTFNNIVQKIVTLNKNVLFLSHSQNSSIEIGGITRDIQVPNLKPKLRDKILGFFDFLVFARKINPVYSDSEKGTKYEIVLWDNYSTWTGIRPPLKALKNILKCENNFNDFAATIHNAIDYERLNKGEQNVIEPKIPLPENKTDAADADDQYVTDAEWKKEKVKAKKIIPVKEVAIKDVVKNESPKTTIKNIQTEIKEIKKIEYVSGLTEQEVNEILKANPSFTKEQFIKK